MFGFAGAIPTPVEVVFFMHVLARISGFFVTAPLFSSMKIPVTVKGGLAFSFALAFFPLLSGQTGAFVPAGSSWELAIVVVWDLFVGSAIGYVALLTMEACEFAGQMVGVQTGIGLTSLLDPSTGQQRQLFAVLKVMVATLLLLCANGHHWLLQALFDSFQNIAGPVPLDGRFLNLMVSLTGNVLVLGVKVAAPVMVCLLCATLVMGVLAKAFPTLNVFSVSFCVNIGMGLLVLGASFSMIALVMQSALAELPTQLAALAAILKR